MQLSQLIGPDIEQIWRSDPASVVELFDELHAEDVADIVERTSPELAPQLVASLPPDRAAEVLECIEPERQAWLVSLLGIERAVPIVEEMAADDRADIINALPGEVSEALLGAMDPVDAANARRLASFAEGTVGAVMTTDIVRFETTMSVGAAIDRLRNRGEDAETVYYLYACDRRGRLEGVVSLKDLLLGRDEQSLGDLLRTEVVRTKPDADQEDAAALISHYDLVALPVCDRDGRLLGIVTVDDVVDVLEEEATEDIHRMAAVSPVDTAYFATRFWSFFGKRAPWLLVLFIGGLFTGDAIALFDELIDAHEALVLFLPLVISSGGNSGSQSASIIIRALAVGEVNIAHTGRVLLREVGMGLALGLMLGLVGVLRALIWGNGGEMAMIVGATLVVVVTLGTVFGSMLPIILERIGLDPAVSSNPFIASLIDIVGILSYFSIGALVYAQVQG